MRRRLKPGALVLAAALAAASGAAQEAVDPPRTGVRGEPILRGVIDLSQPPPAAPHALAPSGLEQAEAAPRPPAPPREGAVPGLAPGTALSPLAAAEPPPDREFLPFVASPLMTEDFAGLGDDNTRIPPDTHGAVGPDRLMVTLNTQVRVSNRTGGALIADRALNTFWGAVGGFGGTFDPRAVYDPYANRWIVVSCDDARSATSGLLLAVSQTGSPEGVWDTYKIDADAGNTTWADFPSIGFNSKWVVVQVNMFTFADAYVRSHIYVFSRSALYAGSAPFTLFTDTQGFTQSPAITYDPAQNDVFMLEEWNPGLGFLRLTRISGPLATPGYSVVGFPGAAGWNQTPPTADHAPQLGSVQKIATNDSRIQNLVYRNGSLWATQTVFATAPTRASIQWWQLSTAAAVLQNARVDDTTGVDFYAFPSIAVNKLGDALIGFSCFSGARYASACYAFRRASDAPNTLRDVATLKPGLDSYYKIGTGSVNRWGDYSATTVDPVNDVDLWTIQEYAELSAGPDRWGTWWGHLALPPDITIDDVSLVEGNSGNANARFTISLSFASTQTVQVSWAAANGTATLADSDFLTASGTVSFPPGTTAQSVDVPVVGDLKFEGNETFVVNLSSPVAGVIADAQGQGTIQNDDGPPAMAIDDVRVVEGNAGTTNAVFTITLSSPSGLAASASWATADGSAAAPAEYLSGGGSVLFVPGDTSETLTVLVNGDATIEPNETFSVDLAAPSGAILGDARGVGTILDDDGSSRPDVTAFTVVSDGAGGATSGRNRLQWVNPVGGSPSELRIRYNVGLGCALPADPNSGGGVISLSPAGAPGVTRSYEHAGLLTNVSYCYTVWAIYGGPASAGVSAIGRPFDATSNLKWKYANGTGSTGVAPPTVAVVGVFAVDNSGDVHGMLRPPGGGTWPAGPPVWYPTDLGSPSQQRSPIVPLASGSQAFLATQDGRVHSIDVDTGSVNWSRSLSPTTVNGAPAGVFTYYGGEHDAILVGTSAADNNVLHALDPTTGAPLTFFGPAANPGIGPISGMPVVDYSRSPQNRVYFASRKGAAPETLWCLNLGPAGPVTFTVRWKVDVGEISGSPVLRNGRIYVGTDAGEVKSVNADTGSLLDVRTIPLGDGPVRGFPFPDRLSDDVYVSTNNKVWRLTDTTGGWTVQWSGGVSIPSPSPPLLRPGATHVYVGGNDGRLYQIRVTDGQVSQLDLDYDPGAFTVGAPSYDLGTGLVLVGSTRGTFYAVQVPVP